MADKILSIADGLHDELPSTTTAKAGRILITTDRGEMYYEPEDKKRVKINKADQTYTPESENAQSGKAVAEAMSNKMDKTNPTGTGSFSLNRKANTVVGNYSFTEGNATVASGYASHAEGYNTTASSYASHAEGELTQASSYYSHAEGYSTIVSGDRSHAEGSYTTASGKSSHAEGVSTKASGSYSHAEGYYTTASSDYQHAQGKYNIADTADTYADIIGNGSSKTKRSNASTVDWNGNAWYAGDVYVGSTSGTNKDEGSKKLATEEAVAIEQKRANNTFANALKGTISDTAILLDDLSPITHEMSVIVRSKNLLPPEIESFDTWENVGTDGITKAFNLDYPVGTYTFYAKLSPLQEGDDYHYLYLQRSDDNGQTYKTIYQIVAATSSKIPHTFVIEGEYKYRLWWWGEQRIFETYYSNFQLELGATSTTYTPYVPDLTSVKVSRFGKNLFDINSAELTNATIVDNGIQITGSSGGLIDILLPKGRYTLSFKRNKNAKLYLRNGKVNTGYITTVSSESTSKTFDFKADVDGYLRIATFANELILSDIQIELGSTATDYEPYKECADYTPNADGTVNGVTSLYPNTTLMTDTDGVLIDCVYNKDTNRTISELSTPVRQTIAVDTPVWTVQPTIDGALNEAFVIWSIRSYFVTLKNTDGTALESGQFKLCTTLDGYASAIEQIFTLTGSSITLTENFLVDFKSISSDRTSFEMRDAGVSSIRINPKNLKSQRFVFALNQLSIVRNINAAKYLYLTDSFGSSKASKVKYYGPVGIYDGANGFLFGITMSSSASINQFGAKIELIRTKNGFITSLLGLDFYETSKTTRMYSGFSNVFDTTEDFRNEEIKWFNFFNSNNNYYFANGTEITLEEFA